jgi:putative oxidoreductase
MIKCKVSVRSISKQTILFLLILLWTYAACSKLADYDRSRAQMMAQAFPSSIAAILAWLVPTAELLTAFLLTLPRPTNCGLLLSAVMLVAFTLYIAGGLLHFYPKKPCPCGGLLPHLGWPWHILLNSVFLLLNGVALKQSKDRRAGDQ